MQLQTLSHYLALSFLMSLAPFLLPTATHAQNDHLIPDSCKLKRPKSEGNCNTTRRYFMHAVRGCKAFGICTHQAEELDSRTGLNYYLTRESCHDACAQGIVCPTLTAPENGNLTSNGLRGWGEEVTYTCDDGYALVGMHKTTCQRTGSWSDSPPICEKQCSPPPNVEHATIAPVHSYYNKGTMIFYTCEEGYSSQISQRVCESGGVWSGSEPVCEFRQRQCHLNVISNGQISAPDRSVGQSITYSCDEGFILSGNATRTCGDEAKWLGDEPVCWKLGLEYGYSMDIERTDITNKTLALPRDSVDVEVIITSSQPNPLGDIVPVWFFKNEILQPNEYPHGVGFITNGLKFSRIFQSKEQEGNYTVVIGSFSVSFLLVVGDEAPTSPPDVTKPMLVVDPSNETGSLGGTVRFSCVFLGCPAPNVTWFHNDKALMPGGRVIYSVYTQHTLAVCHLYIRNISEEDIGEYMCVGSNLGGTDKSDSVELFVNESRVVNTRARRSDYSQDDGSLCEQTSDPDTVTVVARVRKELRRIRSSQEIKSYRLEVSKVLRGSIESQSYTPGRRKLRATYLQSNADDSSTVHLERDSQYVLTGRIVDDILYISQPQHIHHYSTKIESHIQSC